VTKNLGWGLTHIRKALLPQTLRSAQGDTLRSHLLGKVDDSIAFVFALVSGVIGTVMVDLRYLPEQLKAEVNFIHVGGADWFDAIFLAAWFASLLWLLVLLFWAIWRARSQISRLCLPWAFVDPP